MVSKSGDVAARSLISTTQKIEAFNSDCVRGLPLRLESTPDETARRHLGAAIAVGPAEPVRASAAVMPPAKPTGHLRRLAMFALLGAVGLASLYIAMPATDQDIGEIIVAQRVDETSAQSSITVPLAILEEALDRAPHDVLTSAPLSIAVEGEAVSAFQHIDSQIDVAVRWTQPDNLAHVQLVEPRILVFQHIPVQPLKREPSFVELPNISELRNPVLLSSQLHRPSQLSPVQLRPSFVRVRFNNVEAAPVILTTVPERFEKAEPEVDSDPAVTAAPSIEVNIEPVVVGVTASRAAPSRSLRPQLAPENRAAIANSQISRRLLTARQATNRPSPSLLPQGRQSRVTISGPLERPQLIEPKRRVFQRLFGGIPAQDRMTIEKFARENNS